MKRTRPASLSLQRSTGPGYIRHGPEPFSETSNFLFRPYTYTAGRHRNIDFQANSAFTGHDMQATYEAINPINARFPISPLSQQSSYGSETHMQSIQSPGINNSNQTCTSHCREPCFQGQSSLTEPSLMQIPLQSSSIMGNISSLYGISNDTPSKGLSRGDSQSSVIDSNVRRILEELETALMGPDDDGSDLVSCVDQHNSASWHGDKKETSVSQQSEQVKASLQDFVHICKEQHLEACNSDSVVHTPSGRQKQLNQEKVSDPSSSPPSQTSTDSHCESSGTQAEQLLVACAAAIADDNFKEADILMIKLKESVSIHGDPIKRLAAYMAEGLIARHGSSGPSIYKSLKCMEPLGPNLLSPMEVMCEVCPYFKFGCLAANGAIADAIKGEQKVHILDFQIAHGTQWISLIQALSNRPGGPPHVRITGVDDRDTKCPAGGLKGVQQKLTKLAETLGVPFELHILPVQMSELQAVMIEQRPGEALAVNFALQLHHMPDESVSTTNPRDRLLRMVKGMNPKVLTLVEQEANTNTAPFFPRFLEALDYYSAVFESIDVALPRDSKDRITMEQQCLARDIVNIIACEGSDRVERHELIGKWRSRLTMAGFKPHPLSAFVNSTIKTLLELYSKNYRLEEEDGALVLGWLNRPLVVASAWC